MAAAFPVRTVVRSILLISAVCGVGASLFYAKQRSLIAAANVPPPPEMPETVIFATTRPVHVRQSSSVIGTVLAPQSIELRTELAGTIARVPLISGGIVEQGETLLELDASVEQAELQSAEAMMRVADSTFKRTKRATDAKAMTELELEQAAATLAQAQAAVARLEAILRKKRLTAPFRARVGLCDLHAGQYLPEGARITMLQGVANFVHVDFSLPQRVADEVQTGDEVRLLAQPPVVARIVALDSQADRVSRSVMARARVDSPPASMQPLDSIKVEIEFGPPLSCVAAPATALRRSPAGAHIFVVEQDENGRSVARSRTVTPGKTMGDDVMIFRGVEPNRQIVAEGSFKLREGSLVVEPAASPASETVAGDDSNAARD